MLSAVLWSCWVLGLAFGLGHALYVYRHEISEFHVALIRYPLKVRLRAGYYAFWTLVLWMLVGTTVVVFWAIAILPYSIAKLIRNTRTARAAAGPSVRTMS